jgi:hypothetical protein
MLLHPFRGRRVPRRRGRFPPPAPAELDNRASAPRPRQRPKSFSANFPHRPWAGAAKAARPKRQRALAPPASPASAPQPPPSPRSSRHYRPPSCAPSRTSAGGGGPFSQVFRSAQPPRPDRPAKKRAPRPRSGDHDHESPLPPQRAPAPASAPAGAPIAAAFRAAPFPSARARVTVCPQCQNMRRSMIFAAVGQSPTMLHKT